MYPDKPVDELVTRLTTRNPKISLSNYLRKNGNLSPIKASLLREFLDDQSFKNPRILAKKIKNLSLKTQESQPIDRAISSGGGVKFTEVDEHLMLKAYPGIFVAGEMLDWNAPTGGYLINCCMAVGRQAGAGANNWMLLTSY